MSWKPSKKLNATIHIFYIHSARGWSQAKLAEKTGTSTQYIGMIETKIKFPSSEMLHKLAKALGIDLAELFFKEIDPETTMKNARKAVIEDFGEAFYRLISDFVAKKVSEIDENNGEQAQG